MGDPYERRSDLPFRVPPVAIGALLHKDPTARSCRRGLIRVGLSSLVISRMRLGVRLRCRI
ncbi:MAG: hypothetical protein ACO1SX_00045 [Actinomycetota bacterium]